MSTLDRITIKFQELLHKTAKLEKSSCFTKTGVIHNNIGFMVKINIDMGEAIVFCCACFCKGRALTFNFIPIHQF